MWKRVDILRTISDAKGDMARVPTEKKGARLGVGLAVRQNE
jgi:hypothetical protein